MRRIIPIVFASVCLLTCGGREQGRPPTGLESLQFISVAPNTAVPGTILAVQGDSFLDESVGISWLRLSGTFDGRFINLELPAKFIDFDHLTVSIDGAALAKLGATSGVFEGEASVVVDFIPDASRHQSPALPVRLEFAEHLTPELATVQSTGGIFVNEPIAIAGQGLLLGGDEGTTYAVVEGCFVALNSDDCTPVGPVDVPVQPTDPNSRSAGTFAFSPRIAGIFPGTFEGHVMLRNVPADGMVFESDDQPVVYDLLETTITSIGAGGSLGKYIDIQGGGFVGKGEGLTLLVARGEFVPDDAVGGVPIEDGLYLVPEFVDGRLVQYAINEDDDLYDRLKPLGGVRTTAGTFDGTLQAIVQYEGEELIGPPIEHAFRIDPVRQVVWVKFNSTYVESLRDFGLRAMDRKIRDRILEVLVRDYETINVEFREERPQDYKWYVELEIAGPDPNGLGLLGYDNSHGKDKNNERLYDRIGGVNALTQEDGFPGFGGVFIESVFTFSQHPPSGQKSEAGSALFDQIFDPFRPDRGGKAVTSTDLAGGELPMLTNGGGCPTDDRRLQVACAVWVIGSVVGTTVSHELGHSLGLADPIGERFHNLGDGENRLMDKGGSRPFEERAELEGQGPSRYCTGAYQYLREILPTSEPDTTIERPGC